jgi:hypothetical protein
MSNVAARARRITFWLAAAACGAACLALWASWREAARRAALAELRLRCTRKRLRTARAELMEADEYLAATGELLDCYQEAYGALPFNPFAQDASADVGEGWQEVLEEVGLRED